MTSLSRRQNNAILAGLRSLQLMRLRGLGSQEIESVERDGLVPSLSDHEIDDLCALFDKSYLPNLANKAFIDKYRSGKDIPSDDMEITKAAISTRLRNILLKQGFKTIGDLKNLSKYRFLKFHSAGRMTLMELQRVLGRPLSDVVFEEIPGEAFDKALARMKEWDKNN